MKYILPTLFLAIFLIILVSNSYKRVCKCSICKCYPSNPNCNCANCKCGCKCEKKNTELAKINNEQIKASCHSIDDIKQNVILSLRENDKYKYMVNDNLNYADFENDNINYMQMPRNGELYII